LFEQIANALKDCGLANSHHDISLSRDASSVRSKCAKRGGVLTQQTLHFDYDTTAVKYDRLQLPMSLFVYFQATKLFVIDTEQDFEAEDILLLLGDCPHASSRWTSSQMNLRLFCFLTTKYVCHFGKVAFIQPLVNHLNGEHASPVKPKNSLTPEVVARVENSNSAAESGKASIELGYPLLSFRHSSLRLHLHQMSALFHPACLKKLCQMTSGRSLSRSASGTSSSAR